VGGPFLPGMVLAGVVLFDVVTGLLSKNILSF
jgi:hypothetical protein